jgi:uncharacterized protein YbjT (DUF2867 family)
MDDAKKPMVLVCGATGKQGGAVVDALLASDRFAIRALVREPDRARALERRGVELVRGDLLDTASLIAAFSKSDIVFGLTQPWKPGVQKADVAAEVTQGKNLVDACKAVGNALVMSTQIHAGDDRSGIPHADSKLEIESYAKAAGIRMVNVRPASFLDNIGGDWFPVKKGKVQGLANGQAKLPYIATRDIGRAVAAVIEQLPKYVGQALNLVSGLYSGDEIAGALTRLRGGERFSYSAQYPKPMMWLFAREFYKLRVEFERLGTPPYPVEYTSGLEATTALLGGSAWTLDDFLREKGWATRAL